MIQKSLWKQAVYAAPPPKKPMLIPLDLPDPVNQLLDGMASLNEGHGRCVICGQMKKLLKTQPVCEDCY